VIHFHIWSALSNVAPSVRHEYEEAKRFAPERVQQESRFIYFLRAEKGDLTNAALRLCRYWKYRKLLFGQERWLLPMDQTGRGALDQNDIEILRSGHQCVFPNATGNHAAATTQSNQETTNNRDIGTEDQSGPLVLIDLSRLPASAGLYFLFVFGIRRVIQSPGRLHGCLRCNECAPERITDAERNHILHLTRAAHSSQ